jgi:hypothetical protein
MPTYRGIVKGNVVVLPESVELVDGQRVEVRVVVLDGALTGDDGPEPRDPIDEIRQHLVEMGLLSEIRRPGEIEPPGDRRPIKVRGKPLSQVILDERRYGVRVIRC